MWSNEPSWHFTTSWAASVLSFALLLNTVASFLFLKKNQKNKAKEEEEKVPNVCWLLLTNVLLSVHYAKYCSAHFWTAEIWRNCLQQKVLSILVTASILYKASCIQRNEQQCLLDMEMIHIQPQPPIFPRTKNFYHPSLKRHSWTGTIPDSH